MLIKIVVIIALCVLFFSICYTHTGDDTKNMLGLRSYPIVVQNMVRENETLGKLAPKEKSLVIIFVSNLILFTGIFLIVGLVLKKIVGFAGFYDCFLYFLVTGEILNTFDLFVIDLLWWRNTPRIRFSIFPEKELYQDPTVHIQSFYRGIVMYILCALLVATILMVVF